MLIKYLSWIKIASKRILQSQGHFRLHIYSFRNCPDFQTPVHIPTSKAIPHSLQMYPRHSASKQKRKHSPWCLQIKSFSSIASSLPLALPGTSTTHPEPHHTCLSTHTPHCRSALSESQTHTCSKHRRDTFHTHAREQHCASRTPCRRHWSVFLTHAAAAFTLTQRDVRCYFFFLVRFVNVCLYCLFPCHHLHHCY